MTATPIFVALAAFASLLLGLGACSGETHCDPGSASCSCDVDSSCTMSCTGKGCSFECLAGSECTLDCPAGGCNVDAPVAATVSLSCGGGGCHVECSDAASCTVTDCSGGCTCLGKCSVRGALGSACTPSDRTSECDSGLTCSAGACRASCTANDEALGLAGCASGSVCVLPSPGSADGYCSLPCDPGVASSCPSGTECESFIDLLSTSFSDCVLLPPATGR